MQPQRLIDRFFREEKDVFVFIFGVFLIAVFFFRIIVLPFRFDSLTVFFLYLIATRSLIDDFKYQSYLFISLIGLVFTMFLSPYMLILFLFIAMLMYKKTRII